MTPRLSARDLSYAVGDTVLVQTALLDIPGGQHLAIVGPNGAGKTTLVRLLAGELPATTGKVRIDGTDLSGLAESELALLRALLTPDGPEDIPLPVESVVALGRHPHRHASDPASDRVIVNAAMEQLGVAALRRRRYSTLSGGERSLVSLARVLVQETPVVLLDEPTGPLDLAVEERTMRHLKGVARPDRAIVTVGHDLNVVARHADRCLVLSAGHVVADGPPRRALTADVLTEVYRHPIDVIEHPIRDGVLIVVG